jgi:hypothetical protein
VLAKLIAHGGPRPSFAELARDLSMSSSEVHASMRRLTEARLVAQDAHDARTLVDAVEEFLVHGVRYAFPARRGQVTRGMPTAYAAPPLNREIVAGTEPPPVWPDPNGTVRGVGFEPLYPTVPAAASRDAALYRVLALIDVLRDGRARERKLAERLLHARIHDDPSRRSQPRPPRARR